MMMDDLTQEEIKIIMDLRKVEIDNKIKIDKEKMNLFISLYLKKKQKKAKMLDLQKKYTEIQDIFKKEHDDIGAKLVKACAHYAHPNGRLNYEYYCPACDKKIYKFHKYTNVWDEGAIIERNLKGEPIKNNPIKDDPIKDDPIKDDSIKAYLDGNMTNEEIIKKINTHTYNYNLLRMLLEMPETILG